MRRAGSTCLAATLIALQAGVSAPPASAISPPVVDAGAPPPSGTPGPVQPMEQRGVCSVSGQIPGTDPGVPTPSQTMLNLPAAWQFSRGEGQLVAIIDTGVRPGPRLTNVDAGGDFVESTDGLVDCDGHGTLVAGIVAGQPGDDGFSGVAPGARILSVRVTSAKFSPRTPGGDPTLARAAIDIEALSRAIVHAADRGARVINISAITCLPADRPVDQAGLGAAIKYAAEEKDAVIVAAAGNSGPTGSVAGGTSCDSNPLTDLSRPNDPRNWAGVKSVSVPSWWQPYVLSAASLAPDGRPSKFTMAGPWVGIAAPGENIASVSNADGGGLANGLPDDHQRLIPLSGTSYAAGYVSGVAALIRAKYPEMRANEVVRRITATAQNGPREPSNVVGAGTVDAVAALTWQLPAAAGGASPASVKPVKVPPPPAPKDTTPRNVALAGAGLLALLVIVTAATVAVSRRRKEPTP
ncbi:type VII secretion-associated serine protease mycosin [Mycobacterium asiaticum]|uniref:Type VII secretion-associated serine protease mycosin n=1 Tax=Mycobacterium asiaticum TaxID=1790 RepID=A0A1A3UFX6_MYCAS|nr:type VII secretion-associated serine protease mycosin [Mycobacterium asiaticum]OBK22331.1 type VII secretion-associated serine protease mycosin [Mycobacterium asiaticum]OBK93746.1 type VII secretion-associated serine protease mycosin [Mycobacterium asiaticum]